MKYICVILLICCQAVWAGEKQADIRSTQGDSPSLGRVVFKDTPYGLLIKPNLTKLPPGLHGFHIHQHPNCSDHGQGAGGHYDPKGTDTHLGPYGEGHLGDLPALYVDEQGNATLPVLAPRLTTQNLNQVTLMIHAGGDTYSDTPPLGGGGARIACGIIQQKDS